jgi:hypothetical protein
MTSKLRINKKKNAVISEQAGNYEKHPFFVKKANEAKKTFERVGLPKVAIKKG